MDGRTRGSLWIVIKGLVRACCEKQGTCSSFRRNMKIYILINRMHSWSVSNRVFWLKIKETKQSAKPKWIVSYAQNLRNPLNKPWSYYASRMWPFCIIHATGWGRRIFSHPKNGRKAILMLPPEKVGRSKTKGNPIFFILFSKPFLGPVSTYQKKSFHTIRKEQTVFSTLGQKRIPKWKNSNQLRWLAALENACFNLVGYYRE